MFFLRKEGRAALISRGIVLCEMKTTPFVYKVGESEIVHGGLRVLGFCLTPTINLRAGNFSFTPLPVGEGSKRPSLCGF